MWRKLGYLGALFFEGAGPRLLKSIQIAARSAANPQTAREADAALPPGAFGLRRATIGNSGFSGATDARGRVRRGYRSAACGIGRLRMDLLRPPGESTPGATGEIIVFAGRRAPEYSIRPIALKTTTNGGDR
jgi:hypothetical protein